MDPRTIKLDQFHAQERCIPVLWFLLPLSIWMAAMGASIAVDNVYAAAALAIVGGMAGSQLFVLGHDACHGSYTSSRRLNAVIGRVAFAPSAHSYSLWAYFHNGLHHNFTNLRGFDFVWAPTSPEEFSRLSLPRRILEFVYRYPTGGGFGIYYAFELWLRRLVWPTKAVPRRLAPVVYVDMAIVVSIWFLVVGTTAHAFELELGAFLRGLVLFGCISLMITHWAIGFVVYFNHTHPRLKWYQSIEKWRSDFSQAFGACHVTFSGFWWYVLPNVVMNHTLHHLDTRIPARNLAAAETYLASCMGSRLVTWRWTPARHYTIMKRCGLYDFGEEQWHRLDWRRVLRAP